MRNPGFLTAAILIVTITSLSATARMVPRLASDGDGNGSIAAQPVDRSEFKVLVWYRRDDPLATFKYQAYDLRKGDYTKAVDTWIKEIPVKYPAYVILIRCVDLKREVGQTEALKVGSVIKRELMAAAGLAGVFVGGGFGGVNPGVVSPGPRGSMPVSRSAGSSVPDRSFLNASSAAFPFPVPYPRPHP